MCHWFKPSKGRRLRYNQYNIEAFFILNTVIAKRLSFSTQTNQNVTSIFNLKSNLNLKTSMDLLETTAFFIYEIKHFTSFFRTMYRNSVTKHRQENLPLHSSGRLSESNWECQGGIALLPIAILLLSVAILKHIINNRKVDFPMKKLRHDARKNASMTDYTKTIKRSLYRATQTKLPGGFRQKKSRQPPTFPLSQYHRRRGA